MTKRLRLVKPSRRKVPTVQLQNTPGEINPKLRELNERNRKFYEAQQREFEDHISKRPDDAVIAADIVTRQAAISGIKSAPSMEAIVAALARSHSAAQSRKAKNPRRRFKDKHAIDVAARAQCIKECLTASREDYTWKQVQRYVATRLGEGVADTVTASIVSRLRGELGLGRTKR